MPATSSARLNLKPVPQAAVGSEFSPAVASQPTAQQKVASDRHRMPHAANAQRATVVVTRTLQAAAAARIFGKPGILRAAESGDAALVQDHVLADAASVNKRDAWCACPSFVFYNA